MSLKQVINQVAEHLAQQREQAMSRDTCTYRSPSGLKCAVGCLIPDELYDKVFENLPSGNFFAAGKLTDPRYQLVYQHFQTLADDISIEMFERMLRAFQIYHDARLDWRLQHSYHHNVKVKYVEALEAYTEDDDSLKVKIHTDLTTIATAILKNADCDTTILI